MSTFYNMGLYAGEVVNHGLMETKSGKPQFFLEFRIEGEVLDGEVRAVQANYNRTVYQVLTENTIDFAIENIKRLCSMNGVPCNLQSFGQLDPTHDNPLNLIGLKFDAYCKHESYNGEMKERWSIAKGNDGGGTERESLDSKAVRQLDAMFGRVLDKKASGPVNRPQPAGVSEPQPPADDDYPF